MNIKKIELTNFMGHTKRSIDIPDKGLVIISGENGAGKSSFIEGVATAVWGKTLRGTTPWRADEAGSARVEADIGVFERKITKAGTKSAHVDLQGGSAPAPVFDSLTKAKDAAVQVVGDFGVWRRTHVFSSVDADNFSATSDTGRKELLEEILNLKKLAAASDKAQQALKKSEAKAARCAADREAYARDRETMTACIVAAGDPPTLQGVPPAELQGLIDLRDGAAGVVGELRAALRNSMLQMPPPPSSSAADAAAHRLQLARKHLTKAKQGLCDACGQTIAAEHLEQAEKDFTTAEKDDDRERGALAAELEKWERAKRAIKTAATQDELALKEAEGYLDKIQQELAKQQAEANAFVQSTKERVAYAARLNQLQSRWQLCDDMELIAAGDLVVAQRAVEFDTAVAKVLSMKGVRSRILTRCISTIETVANVYLSRLCQRPMEVRIQPYSTSASGVTTEKISMEVIGAGDGNGYWAASGGERRRIDAAVLLAFADIAAAVGQSYGTIWMDEVFDTLDDSGVDAVVEVLEEIAATRAVVVITHSKMLKNLNAVHIKIED